MNRQILNKILIASFIIIWSLIAYNLITGFFGNKKKEIKNSLVEYAELGKIQSNKEIFELPIINRDPFLGNYTTIEKKIPSKISYRKKTITSELPWPHIEYYGFVKGEKSNKPLMLLKINNKLRRIRKGTNVEGILIKEVYGDSILIFWNKEKKIVKKNKP